MKTDAKPIKLSASEAKRQLSQLSNWEMGVEASAIHGEFEFDNYADALAFVNRISAAAEAMNHHPDINFGWGYVDITLTTHSANGLSMNDFILAAKIDACLKS